MFVVKPLRASRQTAGYKPKLKNIYETQITVLSKTAAGLTAGSGNVVFYNFPNKYQRGPRGWLLSKKIINQMII